MSFLCNVSDVCLKHSKVFLDEAEIFQGKSNLIKHKKKGDVVVKGKRLPRHPKCNFCVPIYFLKQFALRVKGARNFSIAKHF